MKKTILTGLVLLSLVGCTQPPTTTNTSTATNTAATTAAGGPLKDEAFKHATLPESVENLGGTANFAEIVELTTASGKGTTFVLLSSSEPDKGVLVVTPDKPEDVQKHNPGQIKVSGPVKELEAGNVTATTKSGANLANKAGKIQYIEAVSIDWGTPAADATGAVPPPPPPPPPPPGGETGTPTPGSATPLETPAPGAETPPATPAETPTP